jgi:hypothetical protein
LSAGNLRAAARFPELVHPHIGDSFFTKSNDASFRVTSIPKSDHGTNCPRDEFPINRQYVPWKLPIANH